MGTTSIVTEGLVKTYGNRAVVDGVDLRFEGGEVVGLLGPNGAGKTTTFYMVVGLIPATKGRVLLNGQDITRLKMHQRARRGIGYLPQEPSVFRKLTRRGEHHGDPRGHPRAPPREEGPPRGAHRGARAWAKSPSKRPTRSPGASAGASRSRGPSSHARISC